MKKLYIVVRTDQEFSRGKLMVHSSHIGTNLAFRLHGYEIFDEWYKNGQIKIVLKGKGEKHLVDLMEKAFNLRCIYIVIEDIGLYETDPDTLIMIGIFATEEQAKQIGLKKLSLYK